MAIRTIKAIPAIEPIRQNSGMSQSTNSYVLCDSLPEFAEHMESALADSNYHGLRDMRWNGGMLKADMLNAVRNGHNDGVELSEKLMAKLESAAQMESRSWAVTDACVGAVPNIPNFIAGNPMSMRQRKRTQSEFAPLCIVADLVSSGSISARDVQNRGAALLALVRLLANVRPIELWASVELDSQISKPNSAVAVCVRLETSPLDLSRASYVLTHPSFPRGLCYAFLEKAYRSNVRWAYNQVGCDFQPKHGSESFARVLGNGGELLFLPPIFARDSSIDKPAVWLADMLKRYGLANGED